MRTNKLIYKILMMIMLFSLLFSFSSIAILAMPAEDIPPVELEGEVPKENNDDKDNDDKDIEEGLNSASEDILNNTSKKDRRIAELTDKYNDKVYGTIAYWLEVAQKYSLPICFIGITIGAFNFLIVGNKKLDKKEQGYGWIRGFTIALVVFNVMPLIFALIAAGR